MEQYCAKAIADCRLAIGDCRLQIAHCLLPIAYCLLPIANFFKILVSKQFLQQLFSPQGNEGIESRQTDPNRTPEFSIY
jgi:hypothetical protein